MSIFVADVVVVYFEKFSSQKNMVNLQIFLHDFFFSLACLIQIDRVFACLLYSPKGVCHFDTKMRWLYNSKQNSQSAKLKHFKRIIIDVKKSEKLMNLMNKNDLFDCIWLEKNFSLKMIYQKFLIFWFFFDLFFRWKKLHNFIIQQIRWK